MHALLPKKGFIKRVYNFACNVKVNAIEYFHT